MLKITRKSGQETYITYGEGEHEIILGSFNVELDGDIITLYFNFSKDLNILRREVLERRGWPLHDARFRQDSEHV